MIDEQRFDKLANATLERVVAAFDEIDPDVVEVSGPSMGVVRLEFGSGRSPWIVNTQRAALQIWLAAERRAWHFAYAEDAAGGGTWVADKTGEELFATLTQLLREHEGVAVSF